MLDEHESWHDWLESPPPFGVMIQIWQFESPHPPVVKLREQVNESWCDGKGLKWRLTGIAKAAEEPKHFDDLLTDEDRKWLQALWDYADAGGVPL